MGEKCAQEHSHSILRRPLLDPIWPVFVACLVIALAEVGALVCVIADRATSASRLDRYWFWGLILGCWLWPERARTRRTGAEAWFDVPLKDLRLGGWSKALICLVAAVFISQSSRILDERTAILVHGAILAPYLLVLCYLALARGSRPPEDSTGAVGSSRHSKAE